MTLLTPWFYPHGEVDRDFVSDEAEDERRGSQIEPEQSQIKL